ncbi:hypothetical protein J6590_015389 [Homalodisca vitripennis]|nr:hypothetical protein J6590_015389 [Homalodisca vitripennis]
MVVLSALNQFLSTDQLLSAEDDTRKWSESPTRLSSIVPSMSYITCPKPETCPNNGLGRLNTAHQKT